MRLKLVLKFFLVAMGLQLVLLVVVCPLVSIFLPNGKMLPEFLVLYIYHPFIRWVIDSGGEVGESSMIWPPVFGTAVGIVIYSVLLGLIAAFVARSRSPNGR